MTDPDELHTSTPEFHAALEREIVGAFRRQRRFARSGNTWRVRKLGVVAASAGGALIALAIGLVFGTSTGYASARVETDRQRDETAANTAGVTSQLAELRADLGRARLDLTRLASDKGAVPPASLRAAESDLRAMETNAGRIELNLTQRQQTRVAASPSIVGGIPMKAALAVTCSALALGAPLAPAPQTIPTVSLPPATAKSTIALWSVAGVRQVAGGKLLVNDQIGREILLFDSTLTSSVVTLDAVNYGTQRPQRISFVAFLGDSSLLADPGSQTIRILDSKGQVARTMAPPGMSSSLTGPIYVDDRGRLLYAELPMWHLRPGAADSVPILRADLASGRIDTVGRVKAGAINVLAFEPNSTRGPYSVTSIRDGPFPSLVPARDDWSMLSDGSIAFVRGRDYHIDWVRADGTLASTPKLPFDWQRVADENAKQLADPRQSADSLYATRATITARGTGRDSVALFKLDSLAKNLYKAQVGLYNLSVALQPNFAATIPDLDGNLWILPTTPARPQNTELVYDVVNAKGELVQRVRVPAGRSIAGFGKGGVVYLVSGDRMDGFYLERTRLSTPAR